MTQNPIFASRPPALALLGLEPVRAALEYASMRLMDKSELPMGDGHHVVIFPGLATDKTSVAPLKHFLQRLGYEACDWGRGFNTGPQGDVDAWLEELADHVAALGDERRLTLIGWSLGGIYAREVAKLRPDRVRQVITIGTPFAGTAEQTHASWVYRLVNGQAPVLDRALLARLRAAPSVPTTSIYSRSDGVVAWQACIQRGRAPHVDNIEVKGSHCGLGWNPKVLAIVADRLRQHEGQWRRYAPAH
jgi:predicted alpha/beta hydrolase family esterase